MEHLLGKTLSELKAIATELGFPAFTAKQMADWLYRKQVSTISEMTNLSRQIRERLAARYDVGGAAPARQMLSRDGTIKYLFPTHTGHFVETVFIPAADRATVCVSSQVGCKMGCAFCMTGRQGFEAQLSATDILNQIYALPERARLTNIVFMGQGEPLDNLDNVLRATEILTASYGYAWSAKRITVSSVGIRKGLLRFIRQSDCHLAISLHSPFPGERQTFMPAERAFSLTELTAVLRGEDFCRDTFGKREREGSHQRRLSFEYIVFGGFNDTPQHARELISVLRGLDCRVNLIRFHTIPDTPFRQASEEQMLRFCNQLNAGGLTATLRTSRGEDIMAACGLLSTAAKDRKTLEL